MQTITCSYHLNKLLSASALFSLLSDNFCRKNGLIISLLMWCSSNLQGKWFPITHNKMICFHMHISVSEFVIHYVVQVAQSCTYMEYSKNVQFMATSPCYNQINSTSCESPRNIYFSTASHLIIIKKTSKAHHISVRVSSSTCPY